MLSRYFRTRRLRAAVRRCQTLLGPQLRHDYGATNDYTLAQITHAMKRSRLPKADLELACAAFMTEPAFNAAFPSRGQAYTIHRDTLERHALARGASGDFAPAAENSDAFSAASGWPPS